MQRRVFGQWLGIIMKTFSSFFGLILSPKKTLIGDFPIQVSSNSPTVKTCHTLIYSNESIVIISVY
jgi:hypothetical protein